MATASHPPPSQRLLRRWLLVATLVLLGVWLTFFDSHSLSKRIQWHREQARLTVENRQLEQRILELEAKLKEADSAEVVEKIAREQYGMRRPGETVYRIEQVQK